MDTKLLLEVNQVFNTLFPTGGSILWRLLTLKEFARFKSLKDSGAIHPYVLHSMVFDHCAFGDVNLLNENLPAGMTISIGECIMWMSGECEDSTLKEDIEHARANYQEASVKEYLKRIIYTAWPSYNESDLSNISYPELLRLFVQAEGLLKLRGVPAGQEYKPLNTKTIKSAAEAEQSKNKINFNKENQEVNKALGDQRHPLDRNPAEMDKIRRKHEQRRDIARKLDQRERRMR
jgi:hypothetical protein